MSETKNYCLEQLELWIEASLDSEATPEEIYNCIRSSIASKIAHHNIYLNDSRELLSLLSGKMSNVSTRLKTVSKSSEKV